MSIEHSSNHLCLFIQTPAEQWDQYAEKDDSIVARRLEGLVQQTVICSECGAISSQTIAERELSLHVLHEGVHLGTLANSMERYFHSGLERFAILYAYNQFIPPLFRPCSVCSPETDVKFDIHNVYLRAPQVLSIKLNRFLWTETGQQIKIQEPLNYSEYV